MEYRLIALLFATAFFLCVDTVWAKSASRRSKTRESDELPQSVSLTFANDTKTYDRSRATDVPLGLGHEDAATSSISEVLPKRKLKKHRNKHKHNRKRKQNNRRSHEESQLNSEASNAEQLLFKFAKSAKLLDVSNSTLSTPSRKTASKGHGHRQFKRHHHHHSQKRFHNNRRKKLRGHKLTSEEESKV